MILEIAFKGYRFFNGLNTLSFLADARTKKLLSNASYLDGRNVLKTIGLYGTNNSGKSNIVDLFLLLKNVLAGKDEINFNNPLFGDEKRIELSIVFSRGEDKGWLKYEFTYDCLAHRYLKEQLSSLSFYESGNAMQNVILQKDAEEGKLEVMKEDVSEFLSFIPSTRPFLYSVELGSGRFGKLKPYLDALKSLANSIEIVRLYNIPIEKTVDAMKGEDEDKKKFILNFVRNSDLSIDDFAYEENAPMGSAFPPEKALSGTLLTPEFWRLYTTYGSAKVPSALFDSSGTKKIEALAAYIYEALMEGKTLIVDELDNGIHHLLARAIVGVFNNSANDYGQLFFTAHDLSLLGSPNIMRKDQIYFLTRDKGGASMIHLSDLTVTKGGPREASDLLEKYNHGDLAPLPCPSFIYDVIALKEKRENKDDE